MSRPPSEFVHWPDGYAPASARVYAHNELVIPTSPDRIWEWLVRARQWPHWYPNSWSVKILKRGKRTRGGQLKSGREFNWITFGLQNESEQRRQWATLGLLGDNPAAGLLGFD